MGAHRLLQGTSDMILSDADAAREEAAREWQMCLHSHPNDPDSLPDDESEGDE